MQTISGFSAYCCGNSKESYPKTIAVRHFYELRYNNEQQDDINAILGPYAKEEGYTPPTPEEEAEAKSALVELYHYLVDYNGPKDDDDVIATGREECYYGYILDMFQPFRYLQRGKYCYACDGLYNALCWAKNPISFRRVRDAIIILLHPFIRTHERNNTMEKLEILDEPNFRGQPDDPDFSRFELHIMRNRVMRLLDSKCYSREMKIAFLKYAIKAVRADLCGRAFASILRVDYTETNNFTEIDFFPIRRAYSDAGLEPVVKKITLSGNKIIVIPTKADALVGATADVAASGFQYDEKNHHAYYYPELDLAIVDNGNHHIAAAAESVPVTVTAQVYSLEPILPMLNIYECKRTVDPPGTIYWENRWIYNENDLGIVKDQRFALLLFFAKEIQFLETLAKSNVPDPAKMPKPKRRSAPQLGKLQDIEDYYWETRMAAIVETAKHLGHSLNEAGRAVAALCDCSVEDGRKAAEELWEA